MHSLLLLMTNIGALHIQPQAHNVELRAVAHGADFTLLGLPYELDRCSERING